ncbi:hypothetical protein [Arabidopsis thaliana]|nr:hypothetical protein [Arabidopsis thaliana]CAB78759.1 hypothetical protein [Arabidopsis thaliana]
MDSRISVSRLSLNHPGSKFGFSLDTRVRNEFIVRAEEGNTEAESEEFVAEIADTEGNVEEVVEAKPTRKPRIKLGDVMGILNQKAIEVAEKVRPVPEIRTGDIVEIKLILSQHQRDKSGESQESKKSKALLSEGQASSSVHFQVNTIHRAVFDLQR